MGASPEPVADRRVSFDRSNNGELTVILSGAWKVRHGMPSAAEVERQLSSGARRIIYDSRALQSWDSSLINFLGRTEDICRARNVAIDHSGLPEGARKMLDLAEAVSATGDKRSEIRPPGFVVRLGETTIRLWRSTEEGIDFLGEIGRSFGRLFTGRARFRRIDLITQIQRCGADALGIVSLISFLVGVILAFMGAIQLQQFGASIYVADLVAIGVAREMGAMMTGIIMAGRTGAAFAAELGTMKVTQEMDALQTMGISPIDFLVLPRMIALVLMMPMLCLYSDLLGILGGALVGVSILHIPLAVYMKETTNALWIQTVAGGLFKASTYGALVAFAGCLRGFQYGRSSAAVGQAATDAVVTGIVMIVTACGLFAVIFNALGI
ncbi:MAG TPA: ABC transporter permease [Candidatus Binataceae bacterium]|nr:ABC transporter permease [Candidatus Binataceae bacterium]